MRTRIISGFKKLATLEVITDKNLKQTIKLIYFNTKQTSYITLKEFVNKFPKNHYYIYVYSNANNFQFIPINSKITYIPITIRYHTSFLCSLSGGKFFDCANIYTCRSPFEILKFDF